MAEPYPIPQDADRVTSHLLACTVSIVVSAVLCILAGLGMMIWMRLTNNNQFSAIPALLFAAMGLVGGVACTLLILLPVVLATEVLCGESPLALRAIVAVCLMAVLLLVLGVLAGLVVGQGLSTVVEVALWGTLVMIPPLAVYSLVLRYAPAALAMLARRTKVEDEFDR